MTDSGSVDGKCVGDRASSEDVDVDCGSAGVISLLPKSEESFVGALFWAEVAVEFPSPPNPSAVTLAAGVETGAITSAASVG